MERLDELAALPGLSAEAANGYRRSVPTCEGSNRRVSRGIFSTNYLLDRTDIGPRIAACHGFGADARVRFGSS